MPFVVWMHGAYPSRESQKVYVVPIVVHEPIQYMASFITIAFHHQDGFVFLCWKSRKYGTMFLLVHNGDMYLLPKQSCNIDATKRVINTSLQIINWCNLIYFQHGILSSTIIVKLGFWLLKIVETDEALLLSTCWVWHRVYIVKFVISLFDSYLLWFLWSDPRFSWFHLTYTRFCLRVISSLFLCYEISLQLH